VLISGWQLSEHRNYQSELLTLYVTSGNRKISRVLKNTWGTRLTLIPGTAILFVKYLKSNLSVLIEMARQMELLKERWLIYQKVLFNERPLDKRLIWKLKSIITPNPHTIEVVESEDLKGKCFYLSKIILIIMSLYKENHPNWWIKVPKAAMTRLTLMSQRTNKKQARLYRYHSTFRSTTANQATSQTAKKIRSWMQKMPKNKMMMLSMRKWERMKIRTYRMKRWTRRLCIK